MSDIESLIQDLESQDLDKRYAALKNLGSMPFLPDEALNALRKVTGDSDPFTSITAQRILEDHTNMSLTDDNESAPDLALPEPETNRVLACEICGRVDDTLRYSEYPYVISLVFVTFQRGFSGLWCRRHRSLYSFLASFITATLGWIGIPYGFIYTPRALFKLAKGGERNPRLNLVLLKDVGEAKLDANDPQGAIRCLEASLEYGEDEEVSERLRELYWRYRKPLRTAGLAALLPTLWVLLGSIVIGMTIGFLDYWISVGISSVVPEEGWIILVILTWTPFIAMAFLGGLLLQNLIVWGLVHAQVIQKALGIFLAIVSASMAIYGILQGSSIAEYFAFVLSEAGSGLTIDVISSTGSVLTLGGLYYLLDALEYWGIAGVIYLVLLLICGAYYYTSSIMAAARTTIWMQKLDGFRSASSVSSDRAFHPAWLSIAAVVLGLSAFSVFFNDSEVFNPNAAIIHNDSGVDLLEQGDFDGAKVELEEAIRLNPDYSIAHSNLCWAYASFGEVDNAYTECQLAIDLDPESVDAYDILGWVSYYLGDYVTAKEAFENVVQLDPQYAEGLFGLGLNQFWIGETEAAGRSFQNAMDLGLADGSTQAGLGLVYLNQDRLEEAEELLDEAVDLAPDYFLAQYGRGYLYFVMNDPEQAETHLRKAIELDPFFDPAHYVLALVLQGQGKFEEAVERLITLSEIVPEWGAPHAALAGSYYQMDQIDLMDQEINLAESMAGEDGFTQYLIGTLYWNLGDYSKAETWLLSAIDLMPDDASGYFVLANVYAAQQDFSRALDASDKAIEIDPENPRSHLARAYVFIEQGKLDIALDDLQKIAEMSPDDWEVLGTLSFVYYLNGDLDQAQRDAEAAVRLNPYDAYAYTNLAFIHYASGQPELALEAAENAIRLNPKYDRVHYILGSYFRDKGDKKKAIAEFETFLELYRGRMITRDLKLSAEAYLEELRQE